MFKIRFPSLYRILWFLSISGSLLMYVFNQELRVKCYKQINYEIQEKKKTLWEAHF